MRDIGRSSQRWTLALTSVGAMMVALDGTVVATALNRIRVDLGASIDQLEWTVNAYILSFAVLLMTGAALGDRFGRRRLFAVGLGLFTVASALCALAPGIGWLIAARTVQGCGAALIMPLAMALLSAVYPPERRARALGLFSGLMGVAVVVGPVAGGLVTQSLAWQWIFWLNVPLGVAGVPLALRRLPESRGPAGSVDATGLALITLGAFGLVWGLVTANSDGWASARVDVALAGGAASVVLFVLWELRAREPMVPMALFRSRGFSAGNGGSVFLYASLYGALFFISQFFQTGLGDRPLTAGLHMLAWTTGVTVVAPLAGAWTNRIGARRLAVTGLALQAAGMFWVSLIARTDMPYWQMITPLIIAGCGLSMAMPAAQISVINAVPPTQIGKASGVFNTLRQFGSALGIAVLAPIFTAAGSYATPRTFTDGFTAAIAVCAGLSLAGAVAFLAIPGAARKAVTAAAATVDKPLSVRDAMLEPAGSVKE
ncbi:MAG TPA: DHA2 family efflux MFS transporter permease subunit [Actinocrinis sp.]|uniref:DHA2 family efflux MFS transporter permease subunit n=1 Tax=Actinocrinis sp. TaxID=1920516 RepID=UPI002DDD5801|nr:DHA2 family efflux MFS transporter permease subunit [Actinocrinis sp.]HEV2344377.1 DHA2 family efflux MFS transporter permease subunit [Actinocrinis sp.]